MLCCPLPNANVTERLTIFDNICLIKSYFVVLPARPLQHTGTGVAGLDWTSPGCGRGADGARMRKLGDWRPGDQLLCIPLWGQGHELWRIPGLLAGVNTGVQHSVLCCRWVHVFKNNKHPVFQSKPLLLFFGISFDALYVLTFVIRFWQKPRFIIIRQCMYFNSKALV